MSTPGLITLYNTIFHQISFEYLLYYRCYFTLSDCRVCHATIASTKLCQICRANGLTADEKAKAHSLTCHVSTVKVFFSRSRRKKQSDSGDSEAVHTAHDTGIST